MRITLEVNDNRFKTFLNFINTLDYVSVNPSDEAVLAIKQKEAIDKGLADIEAENVVSHQQVMAETKKRYPNLFK